MVGQRVGWGTGWELSEVLQDWGTIPGGMRDLSSYAPFPGGPRDPRKETRGW